MDFTYLSKSPIVAICPFLKSQTFPCQGPPMALAEPPLLQNFVKNPKSTVFRPLLCAFVLSDAVEMV